MQSQTQSYKTRVLAGLTILLAFAMLLALGFWQLDRADQKRRLYAVYLEKTGLEPVDLNLADLGLAVADDLLGRKGVVRGNYTKDSIYILDNQISAGIPGYLVFSRLKIARSGLYMLVNRGWVPAGDYRENVPDIHIPDSLVTLTGTIISPPSAAPIRLGITAAEKLENGIIRLQNIDLDMLVEITGQKLLPIVLHLDPASPTAYLTNAGSTGSGAEIHMGYAFQWFALAAVLLILVISAGVRRQQAHE